MLHDRLPGDRSAATPSPKAKAPSGASNPPESYPIYNNTQAQFREWLRTRGCPVDTALHGSQADYQVCLFLTELRREREARKLSPLQTFTYERRIQTLCEMQLKECVVARHVEPGCTEGCQPIRGPHVKRFLREEQVKFRRAKRTASESGTNDESEDDRPRRESITGTAPPSNIASEKRRRVEPSLSSLLKVDRTESPPDAAETDLAAPFLPALEIHSQDGTKIEDTRVEAATQTDSLPLNTPGAVHEAIQSTIRKAVATAIEEEVAPVLQGICAQLTVLTDRSRDQQSEHRLQSNMVYEMRRWLSDRRERMRDEQPHENGMQKTVS